MARDCPIGVEVFVVVVVVVCMSFPQTLVKGCVFMVRGCFFQFFLELCVCGMIFLFLSITST